MRLPLTLACLLIATTAHAGVDGPLPENNPEALRIIEASAATCADEGAGDLTVGEGAYTAADLDLDGAEDDLVLDFDYIQCQFNAAQWGGTGGTPKWFVLDGRASIEVWGGAWQTIDVQPWVDDPGHTERLILVPVHGGNCDGYGAQPCWRVLATFEGQFSTLPVPE